jgi:MFS family permease
MILCGMLSDRLCRDKPSRKIVLAIFYCLSSAVLLISGFSLVPGGAQLALVGAGMFLAAGTTGPCGAMVANLTPRPIHGTAFATLTLANNLLGLAPGPFLTGALADRLGLAQACQLVPLVSVLAALVFLYARSHYENDVARRMAAMNKAAVAA